MEACLRAQKFKIGDRVLAVDGDQSSRNLSRVLDHMRGKERVRFTIVRDGKVQELPVVVPGDKDVMKRRGVHVSGMTVGRTVIPESPPGKMYVHFVDDASIADQAQLNPGDEITSIDGIVTNSDEIVLKTLTEKDGRKPSSS
jgi:C-terminal processing protease CtpA/Prc